MDVRTALALAAPICVSPSLARQELHRLIPPKIPLDGYFGAAVAVDHGLAVVSNCYAGKKKHGRVEVFDLTTGEHRVTLERDAHYDQDLFGCPIALNERWLLITSRHGEGGSWNRGAVHVFDPGTGMQISTITVSTGNQDYFGHSIALSGDLALVGSPYDATRGFGAGAAYLVHLPTGAILHKWIGSDTDEHDHFGLQVALSGRYAVVGANGVEDYKGAVYVFDVATGVERFKLQATKTYRGCSFGFPLSISGDLLLAGAPGENDMGLERSGAAYLFDLVTGAQVRRLSSPFPSAWSLFGESLWLTDELAIVVQLGDVHDHDEPGRLLLFDRDTGQFLEVLTASDSTANDHFGLAIAVDGCTLVVTATNSQNQDNGRGAAYVFPVPLRSGALTCDAQPNSTGSPAVLRASGTRCLLANDLTLLASGLPDHSTGSFLVSSAFDHVPSFGGGQGDLCLASPFARFPGAFDAGSEGLARVAVDLTALPGGQVVLPGETWHFQAWYRDANPHPTSNLTNGMSLAFE